MRFFVSAVWADDQLLVMNWTDVSSLGGGGLKTRVNDYLSI